MKTFGFSKYLLLTLIGVVISGCILLSSTANTLQLEEHPLANPPQLEPLGFQPLQGTQEEILAKHATERAAVYQNGVFTFQDNPAIRSIGDNADLLAVMTTASQGEPTQTVKVMRGETVIFETDAGLPSPLMPLQGLWTYNGHWALEILFADSTTWAGEVFIDGELINQAKGYNEAFSFQLLAGKPFFFYYRNGHAGYSYDGQETDLAYNEIPHYHCCSEDAVNPVQAQNMVAFFGKKEANWFYVELGSFNQ